jgi:N-acyl homoserine lactone hydrolase
LSFLATASLLLDGTPTATADSRLPDATRTGFADKLYRLDCGHSLANDESVQTPGENIGRSIEFSSTLLADTTGKRTVTGTRVLNPH